MRIWTLSLFLLLSFSTLSIAAETPDRIHLMTEPLPPLTISQDKNVSGFSIELLNALFEKVNIAQKAEGAEVLPWARAYQNLQGIPNACLFATARTPQREDKFKWVGPIAPLKIVLFAKKSNNLKIESDGDLKNYKIGTVRDGAPESLLVARGLPIDSLDRVTSAKINIKKLYKGRIDLFSYIEMVGHYYFKQLDYNPADFESVYTLKEIGLYYAFNPQVPDETIQRLQKAYEQLKADGTFERLSRKYLD